MARHGARYLKLLRGNDLAAKARLLQYLDGQIDVTYPRAQNPPRTIVYWVRPFGFELPSPKKVMQSVRRTGVVGASNVGSSIIAGFSFSTPAVSNQIILKRFRAPRAAITFNRTATGTRKTSKITGRSYKSYAGNTVVYPFGAGTKPEEMTEDAVFRIIFQRAKKQDTANVCSFVPGSWSI
jgi:hypothetical protein